MTDDPPKTEAEMRARWCRNAELAVRDFFVDEFGPPPLSTTRGRRLYEVILGAVERSAADVAYVMGHLDEYDRIMGVKSND